MIEIKDADVLKSGVKVFQNFSWKVNAGEHWVISGENGSGKTTLLELIAGVVHVPKGEIHFDFIEAGSWDEKHAARKRDVHYIPAHAMQSLLHSDQGLYYQQRYYGIGDERIPLVRDVLGNGVEKLHRLNVPETFSIDQLLDLEMTRLSNGQLKKVLLLKSLVSDIPRFLLLDYPFEGLDLTSRMDLCDLIDFMATNFPLQVILVDHHHHLPRVMNKRLVMSDCKIIGEESVDHDHHQPNNTTREKTEWNTSEAKTALVEIHDLRIQYGEHVILRDFNWRVNKGERWALVGRNGAGKTTLFSMIFADHPMAYSQNISLFGKRRGTGESIWDIKQRISYLGPELMSYLGPKGIFQSARQYIRSITKKWNAGIFDNIVTHFEAAGFIDKPVRLLSSGQLQLMLIISCFLTDKELLLLDEPFQFLDLKQTKNLRSFLQSHIHEDTTLVLITHYEQDLQDWTAFTKRI